MKAPEILEQLEALKEERKNFCVECLDEVSFKNDLQALEGAMEILKKELAEPIRESIREYNTYDFVVYSCNCCYWEVEAGDSYCRNCGQKLKWWEG